MLKQVALFVFGLMTSSFAQQYFQQYVNYQIDALLNTRSNTIEGNQKLLYVNNSPDTLKEVYFHLYYNKYELGAYDKDNELRPSTEAYIDIYDLQINGSPADNFEIFKTLMKVNLGDSLAPGDTVLFDFVFGAKVPSASGRYGYLGDHYSIGAWYPVPVVYDKEGWHLNQHIDNEFYHEWGDYKVNIHVPKGFIVGATGNLLNPDSALQDTTQEVRDWFLHNFEDTTTTTTWQYEALNVHDFAWAADPDFRYIRREWNGIDINFLVQRHNYNYWIKETRAATEALRFLSEKFGMYPYKQITIVDSYIDAGGMEYPNIVFINTYYGPDSYLSFFRSVVIHEIAHNWFYGLLANNETEFEWMDEGFTQFSEILAVEDIYGTKNNYVNTPYDWFQRTFTYERSQRSWGHTRALKLAKSTKEKDAVNTMPDRFGYGVGTAMYDKAAAILFMLENVLGQEVFWRGIKNYTFDWRFKHPQPEDFKHTMEQASGADLDWFFNQWLNTVHQLDYCVSTLKNSKSAAEYIVEIELKNKATIHMPVDILLVLENNDSLYYHIPVDHFSPRSAGRSYLPEWHFSQKTYNHKFIMDFRAVELIIDPYNALLDVNKLNNSSRFIPKMEWHFMRPQANAPPMDKYIWETWPGLFYNDVDKFKIGLKNLGSYLASDHLIDAHIWYKTYTNDIDFSMYYRHPIRWLNRSGLFTKIWKLDGRQGAYIEFRTRNSDEALLTFKLESYRMFEARYLMYPWQSGTFNAISFAGNYAYNGRQSYSAAVFSIKNSLQGSAQQFALGRLDLKQSFFSKYSDYVLDLNISAGLGTAHTPLQEQFNLAGANGVAEFNEPYYRSRGSLPYILRKQGHLIMDSHAKVRGSTLYGQVSRAVPNNNMLVSSIEFDFPNIFYLVNISFLDLFDNSVFFDAGVVWTDGAPPSFDSYYKSAGISLLYNNFYELNYIFGIDTIKLDFPLWVGKSFSANGLEFRWLLSMGFSFNNNFVFQ